MIMPLDVRDGFALEDARAEAENMLDRPMDMVFHCQTDGGDTDVGEDSGDENEQEVRVFPPGGLTHDFSGHSYRFVYCLQSLDWGFGFNGNSG